MQQSALMLSSLGHEGHVGHILAQQKGFFALGKLCDLNMVLRSSFDMSRSTHWVVFDVEVELENRGPGQEAHTPHIVEVVMTDSRFEGCLVRIGYIDPARLSSKKSRRCCRKSRYAEEVET